MAEIIPAVIGSNLDEIKSKLSMIAPYVKWVQIDVVDGRFAGPATWPYTGRGLKLAGEDMRTLRLLYPGLKIEFHLMIERPESELDSWIATVPDRITVHLESTSVLRDVLDRIKKSPNGIEAGVALKYDTPISAVEQILSLVDSVQLMTIDSIGAYGRPFADGSVDKIQLLRSKFEKGLIVVDGGINLITGKVAREAGADALVAGSAIYSADDIGLTIEEFKKL